jgi:hypothetical protein
MSANPHSAIPPYPLVPSHVRKWLLKGAFLVFVLLVFGVITSASPAPASDVIQTQDSNAPGVVGELTQCKRSEGVLSVKVRFHNTSGKAVEFDIFRGGNDSEREKAYVTAASKKYFILKDSGGEYLTSQGEGGGLKVKLDPGQSYTWWAKFPAPASEVKKLTLMTPVTPPFEDVPITDK